MQKILALQKLALTEAEGFAELDSTGSHCCYGSTNSNQNCCNKTKL